MKTSENKIESHNRQLFFIDHSSKDIEFKDDSPLCKRNKSATSKFMQKITSLLKAIASVFKQKEKPLTLDDKGNNQFETSNKIKKLTDSQKQKYYLGELNQKVRDVQEDVITLN